MQPIINHLVQLQELVIARAQHEVGMPGAQLDELDAAIAALTKELPSDVNLQFSRLLQKGPLAIVPVVNGVCTACGMTLPVSLVHKVHAAEHIYPCPSCARLLFHRASSARNLRKSPRRSDPPKVGIERFSAETLMIPALKGTDRDTVLAEMCQKLADEGFVDDAAKLLESALKREAIISTSVENGLAFPHVRCIEGGALTLALGITSKGIKFDPAGKASTRVIFFMVIPTAASAFYLKLLAGLSQVFQKAENRDKLLEADSAEKLWKALMKSTRLVIQ
jgi:mannitol/fructose-specific phosphotransferase system IIA component (Ntr-type)/predicted RNA-binding Zn-ribbon protein involved in translation (DUF1610 family)